MDAIEFVNRYECYIDEIRSIIRPELLSQLDELVQIDPHDLVTPETWFTSENDARGFVWALFIRRTMALRCRIISESRKEF